MNVAAVIPCRKGSKGVPGKNFRELNSKRLWEWTYETARESGIFNTIIISSDGGLTIYDDGGPYPETFIGEVIYDNARPDELCTDDASLDSVLIYYMKKYSEIDLWCLLQPTSPMRSAEDIKSAYETIKNDHYESLVSVTPNPCMFWVKDAIGVEDKKYPVASYHLHKRPNRQDRTDWFMENGAIYFTKKYVLETLRCRLGGDIALYVMPPERSIEIDTEMDFKIASYLMNGKR